MWDAGHIGRDRVLFTAAPRTQTLGNAKTEKGTKSSSVGRRFRPNIIEKRGSTSATDNRQLRRMFWAQPELVYIDLGTQKRALGEVIY